MKKEKYPILEFDDAQVAKIEPSHFYKKTEGNEYCVITFFVKFLNPWKKKGG